MFLLLQFQFPRCWKLGETTSDLPCLAKKVFERSRAYSILNLSVSGVQVMPWIVCNNCFVEGNTNSSFNFAFSAFGCALTALDDRNLHFSAFAFQSARDQARMNLQTWTKIEMTTETPWGLALQRLEHATADSKAINCFGTSAAQSALLHLRHWAKHVKQSGRWATSGHKRQEGNGTKQMQMPSMKPWLQAAPIQISTDAPMRDRKTFETWADIFFSTSHFFCVRTGVVRFWTAMSFIFSSPCEACP
jgi:hypothetical protein